jgi:ankyrin repeat protein
MSIIMGCDAASVNKVGNLVLTETFPEQTVLLIETIFEEEYSQADKLIEQGADINHIGEYGLSPLLWIMSVTQDAGTLEYMLKKDADPNYRGHKRGHSPMYFAAGGNRKKVLELFLQYGGDPNLEGVGEPGDAFRESMLMVAIHNFREEYFELLLSHGADVNWNSDGSMGIKNVPKAAMTVGRFDWTLYFLEKGYKGDMQALARSVEAIKVSDRQKPNKQKVIDYLKSRGVEFDYN